jgi:hypothetical protein
MRVCPRAAIRLSSARDWRRLLRPRLRRSARSAYGMATSSRDGGEPLARTEVAHARGELHLVHRSREERLREPRGGTRPRAGLRRPGRGLPRGRGAAARLRAAAPWSSRHERPVAASTKATVWVTDPRPRFFSASSSAGDHFSRSWKARTPLRSAQLSMRVGRRESGAWCRNASAWPGSGRALGTCGACARSAAATAAAWPRAGPPCWGTGCCAPAGRARRKTRPAPAAHAPRSSRARRRPLRWPRRARPTPLARASPVSAFSARPASVGWPSSVNRPSRLHACV